MKIFWMYYLAVIFLLIACDSKINADNPLEKMKKGLWMPSKESPKRISKRLIDNPDSIRFFSPPLWILGDATDALMAKQDIFFEHELYTQNGQWFVNDCSISLDNDSNLICVFIDAEDEKIHVNYKHVIKSSLLPKENLVSYLRKFTWFTDGKNINLEFSDSSNTSSLLAVFRDSANQVIEDLEKINCTKLIVFNHKNKLLFLTIDPLYSRESFVVKELNAAKDSLVLISLDNNNEIVWNKEE